MTHTILATQQTIWDCRWSRPGHRLTGVNDAEQPEALWVCVRTGKRRGVDEHECARCPDWATDEQRSE